MTKFTQICGALKLRSILFIATTTVAVPTAPGPFECPEPNGYFPSPYSCSQYYVCLEDNSYFYVSLLSYLHIIFRFQLTLCFSPDRLVLMDFIITQLSKPVIGQPMSTAICLDFRKMVRAIYVKELYKILSPTKLPLDVFTTFIFKRHTYILHIMRIISQYKLRNDVKKTLFTLKAAVMILI